jgi:heptosyltransferase-1
MSSSGIPLPEEPRLLLIRLGAMGDVIHALPAAALLRRALPKAEISWAVEPRWAPLLAGNPAIDRTIEVPLKAWRGRLLSPESRRGFGALRDELRSRHFDLTVDFQGLLKSAVLGWVAKPGRAAGFESPELRESLAAWFYTDRFSANRQHVVDKNLALARAAAGVEGESTAEAWLPEGERLGSLPEGDFLLASPLAGWKSKQWPPEHYGDLAELAWEQRRLPLVLDGAPGDEPYLAEIAEQAPRGACHIHLSSLPQLIGATRAARAVVGLDSGPLHLAAALGKRGVALFGPTDPARNGPYGESFTVLRRPGAETTYKRRDHYVESMIGLPAAEVWAALSRLLDLEPRGLEVVSGAPE